MSGIHVAVVDNLGTVELERVQTYLPSNYQASKVGSVIVVEGRDVAGWTFLDYVQPRLATGGIFLRDVTPHWSKVDQESVVARLGEIHEEIQDVLDRLDDIPTDDLDYPYTAEEMTEAKTQLGWGQQAVYRAIQNREEEYRQLLDRWER